MTGIGALPLSIHLRGLTHARRRAYDRSLLHRGPKDDQFARYHPHAPHPKTPRATHAWKYSYNTRTAKGMYTGTAQSNPFTAKKPPPDYAFNSADSTHRPPPNMYHDVLTGKRKRKEDEARELDRVQRSSSLLRALNLGVWLAIPVALAGFFGGLPRF